jgi:hypothetical protein
MPRYEREDAGSIPAASTNFRESVMAKDDSNSPAFVVVPVQICDDCASEIAKRVSEHVSMSREERMDRASDAARRSHEALKNGAYSNRN